MNYLHLQPEDSLPSIVDLKPFRTVVIVESVVSMPWQDAISNWLVESGCLYMMAWGINCSSWDDSVDYANLEIFDYGDIPDDKSIMTTWHENETLEDVFWSAKHNSDHPTIKIENTLLLHISNSENKDKYLNKFKNA